MADETHYTADVSVRDPKKFGVFEITTYDHTLRRKRVEIDDGPWITMALAEEKAAKLNEQAEAVLRG